MTVLGAALLLAIAAVQAGDEAVAPANTLEARCREWLALRLRIEASGARPATYADGLAKLLLSGDPQLAESVATASAPEPGGPFEPVAEHFCREVGHLLDDSAAIEAAALDDSEVESIASLVGVVATRTPEPRRVPLVAEWRVRKLERTSRIALQQLESGAEQSQEQFASALERLVDCVVGICSDVKAAGHANPTLASRGADAAIRILTAPRLSLPEARLLTSRDGAPTLRAKLFEKCFELLQDQPSEPDVTAGTLQALATSTLAHASTASLLELFWLCTRASTDARNRLHQAIGTGDLESFATIQIDVTNRAEDWAENLVTPGASESAGRVKIDRVVEVDVLHGTSWYPLELTTEQLDGHAMLPLLPKCRLRVRFADSSGDDTIDTLVVCEEEGARLRLEMPSPMPGGYCAVLLSSRKNRLHIVARDGWTHEQFALYAKRSLGSNNIGSSSGNGPKAIAELLKLAVGGVPSSNGSAPPITTSQERDTALQKLRTTRTASTRFEPMVPPEKDALLSALANDNCKLNPITNEVLDALEFIAKNCVDPPIAEWSRSTHAGAPLVITADSKGIAKLASAPAASGATPPRFLFVDQINYTIGTPADRDR